MYVLRNHLGPCSHVLAGLLPLAWYVALRPQADAWGYLGLALLCAVLALLPDIDSATSHVGRLVPPLSREIEKRWGHRTITHSLTVALPVVAVTTRLLYPDGWLFLTAAYGSHLLLDMIVGETGLPLLWPGSWHFYLAGLPPAGTGEAIVTDLLALGCLLPIAWPATAQSTAALVPQPPPPTPTNQPTSQPTSTPYLVTVKIPHVYDPAAEILVQPGDEIVPGQPLADLATYRQILLARTPTPTTQPTNQPTSQPTSQPTIIPSLRDTHLRATALAAVTATPTPTETPTPTATRHPEPALSKAEGPVEGPTPAHNPRVTIVPNPWHAPPTPNPTDPTRVYTLVAGRVAAVEIVDVAGNEATVEIVIELP